MSKAAFLDSVAGVAGDMFVASFVDAGVVTATELEALPGLLGLSDVEMRISKVHRAQLEATHVRVAFQPSSNLFQHSHEEGAPPHEHHHETEGGEQPHIAFAAAPGGAGHVHYADIDGLLVRSKVGDTVRQMARRIFRLLAEAEATVHGVPVDDVAFHELGAVDSIMDVVMAAYCVDKLGPCALYASPVRAGRGSVKMAHGTYPIPPPASLRLLAGLPVAPTPEGITRTSVELSTPTGIAILKALKPQFVAELPAGTIIGHGAGAGTMDLGEFPNIFRVIVFDDEVASGLGNRFDRDQVVEIACTIDDDTAEHMAWLAAQTLVHGALDAWLAPVTGKKGRPAACLSVLAAEADWAALAAWILEHSTTFGVRFRRWDRLKLFRRFERRESAAGTLTFKVGTTRDGTFLKEKPEFEDLSRTWNKPGT